MNVPKPSCAPPVWSAARPPPLRDEQTAGVGDVVLTRRNDRRITVGHRGDWVRNGSLFTVQADRRGRVAAGAAGRRRRGHHAARRLRHHLGRPGVRLDHRPGPGHHRGHRPGHRPPGNDPATAVRGDVPRPRREPRPHRGRTAARRGRRTRPRRPRRQCAGPAADHRPGRRRTVRDRDPAGGDGRTASVGQPGAAIRARHRDAGHRAATGKARRRWPGCSASSRPRPCWPIPPATRCSRK